MYFSLAISQKKCESYSSMGIGDSSGGEAFHFKSYSVVIVIKDLIIVNSHTILCS